MHSLGVVCQVLCFLISILYPAETISFTCTVARQQCFVTAVATVVRNLKHDTVVWNAFHKYFCGAASLKIKRLLQKLRQRLKGSVTELNAASSKQKSSYKEC